MSRVGELVAALLDRGKSGAATMKPAEASSDRELVVGRSRSRVPVDEHHERELALGGRRVHRHSEEPVAVHVVELHVDRAHCVRAHRLGEIGVGVTRTAASTTIPATVATDCEPGESCVRGHAAHRRSTLRTPRHRRRPLPSAN